MAFLLFSQATSVWTGQVVCVGIDEAGHDKTNLYQKQTFEPPKKKPSLWYNIKNKQLVY